MKVPRAARASIRRLHTMIGHKPKAVMVQILRGARAKPELIYAVKFFRCDHCDANMDNPRKSAVAAPPMYSFNHEVMIDVFWVHDMDGQAYGILSVVCNGTTFHIAAIVMIGHGVPLSGKCYRKFDSMWARWAGWPKVLTSDRGLHNRGEFARGLRAQGTYIRQAALEVPEHIGRAERHGGILKGTIKRIIKEHHVTGKKDLKLTITVALETKNDQMRRDGFSPSQWVLARYPRRPGSMLEESEWGQLGVLQAQQDSRTAFGMKAAMRFTAQRYFVYLDCGRRFRESQLRKARHVAGDYQVGNVVMYKVKHQGARAPGDEWVGPARIIGFENQVVWLQSAGQPVASAVHLLRPCSTPELLAWQISSRSHKPLAAPPQDEGVAEQQGYLDAGDLEGMPDVDSEDEDIAERDGPTSTSHTSEPESKRRRHPPQRRAKTARTRSPAASAADDMMSPLEKHLEKIGVPIEDPGRRLTRSLASASSAMASFATASDVSKSTEHGQAGGVSMLSEHVGDNASVSHVEKHYVCLMAKLQSDRGWDGRSHLTAYRAAQSFFADRICTPAASAYLVSQGRSKARQKASLEKRGKLLTYRRCDADTQSLLDKSRLKEWNNYLSFGAAKVISAQQAREYVEKGAEELPTQWIERDKNEFKRLKDVTIEPDMKSRLVARGDLSKVWTRSDSPTADKEAVFILFSFASSRKLRIKSGDLDHGYFQGEKLSKPLILRQPDGGLPDPNVKPDDRMMCFVPIYGTRDAGRGLWRRIRKVLISAGFAENFIMPALYSYAKNGIVLVMLASHVDDIIWAADPEGEAAIEIVKTELIFGALDEGTFRFCGIEILQQDDFVIRVSCTQTSKKLTKVAITSDRAKHGEEPATAEEQEGLRSSVGGLMWVSRSCRPGVSYQVSTLQTAVNKPFVEDVLLCNKTVQYVQETADKGMIFRSGLRWPSPGDVPMSTGHAGGDAPKSTGHANLGDDSKYTEHSLSPSICIIACTDASHGGEDEWLDEWQEREPFRSQGAKLIFIADTSILEGDEAFVHLVSFSSTAQKRVVSSTMKAESYQLQDVVEAADLIRAAIADAHGALDHKDWEQSAASWCKSLWLTDCKSCRDSLHKPVAKGIDKRLGIELASLRQFLWRRRYQDLPDRRLLEELPPIDERTDLCRWIDTTVMACDCLTKTMREDYLLAILESNKWNVAQTAEAKAIKLRKAEGVQRRKAERKEAAEDLDEG